MSGPITEPPPSEGWSVLKAAAIALGFIGVIFFLRRALGIELDPHKLRPFVQDFGAWGPVVFIAIATGRIFLGIPSQLVFLVGGLCFGTALGTLYGGLGLTISGIITFLAARWAGREAVENRVPVRMRPLFDRAGTRLGALFIFVGTAYPVGLLTAYYALAGLTQLSLWRFAAALAPGSLVRAGLYSHFGNNLLAGGIEPLLISSGLIAAVAVIPLLFPRSRRWISGLLAR